MKNKWIILVGACIAVGAVNAAAPMVCAPNYGPSQTPRYGNGIHPGAAGYGAPPPAYSAQQHPMQYGNFGYPPQYGMQHQSIPYGMMPPPGMMPMQPGYGMQQQGMMPMQPSYGAQQQNMNSQVVAGGKCTCQKPAITSTESQNNPSQVPQGPNVVNDNGVVKVYGSSTSATGQTTNAAIKIIYDDSHPSDMILVRPTNMTADQKKAIAEHVSGVAASSSNSFNSALAGMNDFSSVNSVAN